MTGYASGHEYWPGSLFGRQRLFRTDIMSDDFQLFNLGTMSGVFPGTRTMVYQRVRLAPEVDAGSAQSQPAQPAQWARILWYADPPACVLELEMRGGGETRESTQALLRIPDPLQGDLMPRVEAAAAAAGWRLRNCGTCAHWQPLTARNPDGLPTGRCGWQAASQDDQEASVGLSVQSGLALECVHWQSKGNAPQAATYDHGTGMTVGPIRRRAELESDERWTFMGQIRRFLGRGRSGGARAEGWAEKVMERSGVGAGTESCFACQARIANLGALAVATPEGDKQTFSVWRCRNCYTYYLNDWIDRWERTDSLETEERYYRLAPAEALAILAVIENVVDAEHPARRHERDAQRSWMLAFMEGRQPLSHQLRQGR